MWVGAAILALVLGHGAPHPARIDLGLGLRYTVDRDGDPHLLLQDAIEPGPPELHFPMELRLTQRLRVGDGKIGKAQGALLSYALTARNSITVGVGAYIAKPVPGAPSDWRFLAVLCFPFP